MNKYNNPHKASHTVPATEYTLAYNYTLPDRFEMDVHPHLCSTAQKGCLCLKMSLILAPDNPEALANFVLNTIISTLLSSIALVLNVPPNRILILFSHDK